MRQLLVSDYDDTFYRTDEELEVNKVWVNRFVGEGNLFTFATGRSYESFKVWAEQCDLFYNYLILCNGAIILDHEAKLLWHQPLSDQLMAEVDLAMNSFKEDIINRKYCSPFKDSMRAEELESVDIVKVRFKEKKAAECFVATLNQCISELNCYLLMIEGGKVPSVEIVAKGISKSHAITWLVDHVSVDYHQVYTVGDSQNDLEMLTDFNGCKMPNADAVIKRAIGQTTPTVSKLIESILKKS